VAYHAKKLVPVGVAALPELTGLERRPFRLRPCATRRIELAAGTGRRFRLVVGLVQGLDALGRHPQSREAEDLPLVRRLVVVWRALHAVLSHTYLGDCGAAMTPLVWPVWRSLRGKFRVEGTPDQDQYLTALQVGQEMGVSDQTVYNWIREKRLPATKIARSVRVRRSDLERMIAAHSTTVAAGGEEGLWDDPSAQGVGRTTPRMSTTLRYVVASTTGASGLPVS
jgi:excisionase family DNA binding protein